MCKCLEAEGSKLGQRTLRKPVEPDCEGPGGERRGPERARPE